MARRTGPNQTPLILILAVLNLASLPLVFTLKSVLSGTEILVMLIGMAVVNLATVIVVRMIDAGRQGSFNVDVSKDHAQMNLRVGKDNSAKNEKRNKC